MSDAFLTIDNVVKQFSNTRALDGVTFEVPRQCVFGMLGPNGAGKTTTIRIITTILRADSGKVLFDGAPLKELDAEKMGYMPEERGLYKKMKVWEQLVYLAQLKGLNSREAKQKVFEWMEKFEIKDWWNKKVGELSKGMSQKVQFIATVLHNPRLIILDEPFSGLDPINSKLIEDEIQNLRRQGSTIIFSTHRMEQVEEICERIVLYNKGKIILSGKVADIKQQFKKHEYTVKYNGDSPQLSPEQFQIVDEFDHELVLKMKEGNTSRDLLQSLMQQPCEIVAFEERLPSLNEIFIEQVALTSHE